MNQYKFEKGFNIKKFVVVISAIILVAYGFFNARNLLIGPVVEIWSPISNSETWDNMIVVKGRAQNITSLRLNEKPIFVDTDGIFQEKMLLSPGLNTIEVKAEDRFKKEITKTITMYYKR